MENEVEPFLIGFCLSNLKKNPRCFFQKNFQIPKSIYKKNQKNSNHYINYLYINIKNNPFTFNIILLKKYSLLIYMKKVVYKNRNQNNQTLYEQK